MEGKVKYLATCSKTIEDIRDSVADPANEFYFGLMEDSPEKALWRYGRYHQGLYVYLVLNGVPMWEVGREREG